MGGMPLLLCTLVSPVYIRTLTAERQLADGRADMHTEGFNSRF